MLKMIGEEEIAGGFDTVRLVANLEQMDKDHAYIMYGILRPT